MPCDHCALLCSVSSALGYWLLVHCFPHKVCVCLCVCVSPRLRWFVVCGPPPVGRMGLGVGGDAPGKYTHVRVGVGEERRALQCTAADTHALDCFAHGGGQAKWTAPLSVTLCTVRLLYYRKAPGHPMPLFYLTLTASDERHLAETAVPCLPCLCVSRRLCVWGGGGGQGVCSVCPGGAQRRRRAITRVGQQRGLLAPEGPIR